MYVYSKKRFFILVFKSNLQGYYGTNEIPFYLQSLNSLKQEPDDFILQSEQQ